MPLVTIALALLALIGHAAFWVGLINRLHATGVPRQLVKGLSAAWHLVLALVPLIAAGVWWRSGEPLLSWLHQVTHNGIVWIYVLACWFFAIITLINWTRRTFLSRSPKAVLSRHSTTVDIAAQLGFKPLHGPVAKLLSFFPGNQILKLSIDELHLQVPRLPAQLDGLSIALLSDIHITGRLGIDFFKEVVRQTNALHADMILIAGDILDEIELLDWIPQALSSLSAPLGVYFVLGNHDQFTRQAPLLRQALTDAGWIDVGNRWRRLEHSGAEIILAGNEMPWFSPAPDMRDCPMRSSDHPQLRLLLSHSPDTVGWARRQDIDLMFAGHVHGGQIRVPFIGPIFSPSSSGVEFASGTFQFAHTLMHVSRGVGSELPLRLNCPPELTKVILHTSAQVERS